MPRPWQSLRADMPGCAWQCHASAFQLWEDQPPSTLAEQSRHKRIHSADLRAEPDRCQAAFREKDPTLPPLEGVPFNFFFNDTPTTEIYTLSLHDALGSFLL